MISNNKIYISAKQKIGIAELIELISGKIFSHYIECNMFIPYEKGNLISYLNDNAYIKSVIHKNKGTFLSLECRESDHKRLKQFVC
jgi:GTP-binding protein HflX